MALSVAFAVDVWRSRGGVVGGGEWGGWVRV